MTLAERVRNINFARLNYILIPDSREDMERLRSSWAGRYLGGPATWLYRSLSRTGRVVAVLMPSMALLGLDVMESHNHRLAALLLGALLAALVLRRAFALGDVSIAVQTPGRVSVGEDVVLRVTLRNGEERPCAAIQVERPFLSWDGAWVTPPLSLDALGPSETVTLQTRARFSARGRHYLDPFFAAEVVPMRLTLGPGVVSSGTPLLVVPRVLPLSTLRLGMAPRFQPGGVALASKTGESTELYGLRPYRRGDRLRDLHARSWARTGKPVVREYQQEYFTRVGVFLDTDQVTTTERGFEAAICLAAGVVFKLSRGEALIDLLVTGDTLHALTVGRALGSFEQALDHLACTQAGPSFDCERTLRLLAPHLGRLSSMVLVLHGWDLPRMELARRLEGQGVAVKTVVVGEGLSTDQVRHVSIGEIEAGDPVAL